MHVIDVSFLIKTHLKAACLFDRIDHQPGEQGHA